MHLLVICVFAYWLMKHLPEVVTEAAQGIGYGLKGEESPAARARRQRLEDAGIDPAAGGAFGQFVGNVARDFWLDMDNARRRRRAERQAGEQADADRSWWQAQRDRFDDLIDAYADRWRRRQDETEDPAAGQTAGGGGAGSTSTTGGGVDDQTGAEDPPGVVHDTDEYKPGPDAPPPRPDVRPDETPTHARGPIRVNATVGNPVGEEPATAPTKTATAVLELEPGGTMSATVATRGIPVTGVMSGAQECLAIHRFLETAVAEFQLQLDAVAARVHSMGEQTLGIVQFAGASDVVTRMAQAAEAIAATRAAAAALGSEVGPLLTQTRTEFLKRSN